MAAREKIATSDGADSLEADLPRKPERINGRDRYERLVGATEAILEREGSGALTIQKIAQEAAVPKASVYHFFPSPAAACVAVAESYLSGFSEAIGRRIPNRDRLHWQELVAVLQRRTVEYYRAHPYAQKLILGSDYSWHIRKADLINNRVMAETILDLLRDRFDADEQEMLDALAVAISLSDAVWSLSVAEHGTITRSLADEAIRATCSYLAARLQEKAS